MNSCSLLTSVKGGFSILFLKSRLSKAVWTVVKHLFAFLLANQSSAFPFFIEKRKSSRRKEETFMFKALEL